jgi:hypothetical protein
MIENISYVYLISSRSRSALSYITDQFHSYDDVGWCDSGVLVIAGVFQPLYERVDISFHVKIPYPVAASNSAVLIMAELSKDTVVQESSMSLSSSLNILH